MIPDMEIEMIWGICFTFAVMLIGYALDHNKKVLWSPIMFLMDVPVALSVGVLCVKSTAFTMFWMMGIFMICLSVFLSIGGAYLALNFGAKLE